MHRVRRLLKRPENSFGGTATNAQRIQLEAPRRYKRGRRWCNIFTSLLHSRPFIFTFSSPQVRFLCGFYVWFLVSFINPFYCRAGPFFFLFFVHPKTRLSPQHLIFLILIHDEPPLPRPVTRSVLGACRHVGSRRRECTSIDSNAINTPLIPSFVGSRDSQGREGHSEEARESIFP